MRTLLENLRRTLHVRRSSSVVSAQSNEPGNNVYDRLEVNFFGTAHRQPGGPVLPAPRAPAHVETSSVQVTPAQLTGASQPPALTPAGLRAWVEGARFGSSDRAARARLQRNILKNSDLRDGALISRNLLISGPSYSQLKQLPPGLAVYGLLAIDGTKIEALPPFCSVGALQVQNATKLRQLGEGFFARGDVQLGGCHGLHRWPEQMRIEGRLVVAYCQSMQQVPQPRHVHGDIEIYESMFLSRALQLEGSGQWTARQFFTSVPPFNVPICATTMRHTLTVDYYALPQQRIAAHLLRELTCPLTLDTADELSKVVYWRRGDKQVLACADFDEFCKWWSAQGTDPTTRESLDVDQLFRRME